MAITKRTGKRGTVYWVDFTWQGKRVWERSGADKRAAERLLAQRRKEVASGEYLPAGERRATTFGQWLGEWLDRRRNRNADNETAAVRRHVMGREWLTTKALADLRVSDMSRLVDELRATVSEETLRPLSSKTVANLYGSVRTALGDARRAEAMLTDPCILPRGTFRRRAGAVKREPYTKAEVQTLVTHPAIPIRQRVWNALALLTGLREGEVCGRTWADWDRTAKPFSSLHIHTQYDGQPLKTEREAGEHPRFVPVHPVLERLLSWWFAEGFELCFGRAPTPSDPIVPSMDGSHYTRWAAYNAWRRGCAAAGVRNRSLHSTRHTFITLTRRGGARKDLVEKITHNSAGDIVDTYTHVDWAPLCQAVAAFGCDADVDSFDDEALFTVPTQGFEPRLLTGRMRDYGALDGPGRAGDPCNSSVGDCKDADCDAAHSEEPPAAGDEPPPPFALPSLLPELAADAYALRLERAEDLRDFRAAALGWFRRAA